MSLGLYPGKIDSQSYWKSSDVLLPMEALVESEGEVLESLVEESTLSSVHAHKSWASVAWVGAE